MPSRIARLSHSQITCPICRKKSLWFLLSLAVLLSIAYNERKSSELTVPFEIKEVFSMPIVFCEKTNVFHLFNDRVSYIIRLAAGKYPLHVYWGKRVGVIRDDVLSRLTNYTDDTFSLHELPLDVLPQECPTFGTGDLRPGMLHVRHADGTHALDLQVVSHRIQTEKPTLSGLPSARGEQSQTLLLTLRDAHSGISIELAYPLYDDIDIPSSFRKR